MHGDYEIQMSFNIDVESMIGSYVLKTRR